MRRGGLCKLANGPLATVASILFFSLGVGVAQAGGPNFRSLPGSPYHLPAYGGSTEFNASGRMLGSWSLGAYPAQNKFLEADTLFSLGRDGAFHQLPDALAERGTIHSPGPDIRLGPFSPDGKRVIVCRGEEGIDTYSVTASGFGRILSRGKAPNFFCQGGFARNGRLLTLGAGSLYLVGQDGSLTRVRDSQLPDNANSGLSPQGLFVTVTDILGGEGGAPELTVYRTDDRGDLTAAGHASLHGEKHTFEAMTFSANSRFLALAYEDRIWMYRLGGNGALTPAPGDPYRVGPEEDAVAMNAGGTLLAATDDERVFVCSVGDDGTLHQIKILNTAHNIDIGANGVAFDPHHPYLAATNQADGTLSVLAYH